MVDGVTANNGRLRVCRLPFVQALKRVAASFALVAVTSTACSLPPDTPAGSGDNTGSSMGVDAGTTYASTAQVLEAVKAAQDLNKLPESVAASLTKNDQPEPKQRFDCKAVNNPSNADQYGECAFGDPSGKKLMVVYGDSRADMWAATLEGVAKASGWKLRVFAKHACPGPDLQFMSMQTRTPNIECDLFHRDAGEAVKALKPDLVLVTSMKDWLLADGSAASAEQWLDGWVSTIDKLARPGTGLVVLGDIAQWNDNGARCLAAHTNSVQRCSAPVAEANWGHGQAEEAVATAVNALYIPTIPWFCAERCEPVIADIRVFNDGSHITQTYAVYLTGAMREALKPAMA